MPLQDAPAAERHVNAARQAGIEAADGPHDVDALERLRRVLLEDRLALDGVLVRPGRSEPVSRVGIPGCRRVGGVCRALPATDAHVMGEDAAYRFREARPDRLVWDVELLPRLGVAGPDLL